MSLVSPRPTTMVRPSFSSKVWSPDVLTSRNVGMAEYTTYGEGQAETPPPVILSAAKEPCLG
jgi:hypothetical protein